VFNNNTQQKKNVYDNEKNDKWVFNKKYFVSEILEIQKKTTKIYIWYTLKILSMISIKLHIWKKKITQFFGIFWLILIRTTEIKKSLL